MGLFDAVRDKFINKDNPVKDSDLDTTQDQPREDIELCSYVKNKVEEVRTHANRVSHEGIWMTNIAYVLGYDSVYYDSQLRQFKPVSPTGTATPYVRRDRIHSNLILPDVQNRLARMLKNPPQYDVRPNEMTEEDKDAARLGVEVINSVWDKQGINRKRIDLGMWVQQCGHSYGGICWDDQLGEPLVNPQTEEFEGYEGDIRFDVVSAFEGFADPLAKTFEECSWFARAKVRKIDYFRTHYDRGHLVKEEGVWLLSTQYEMRINTLNTVGPNSSGTSEQMKNAAIEISYYEKRSKKYPNGRHVVMANGALLKNDDLPVGEIPYAKFDDVVIGGKYYSESLITHARPLQDQYNRTLKKRAEWVNKLLAGKYIAAKGHGLMQEAMNDQSGEVAEFDPVPNAPPPSAMSIPVMPSYAYTETTDLEKKVHDIFGLSEVSRGQLPSASIPAIGIQLLIEQDATRIGIEVEQHEHAWARIGMLILKYADKYWITDRKLKTKGEGMDYKIKKVNGASIKKNFDVTVIRGSTVPNSKVLHRQETLNLLDRGLLGDPNDPAVKQKVLAQLQYGGVAEAWEDLHLDMTQILEDIDKITEEVIPEVNKLDNHALHLVQKNRFRKGEKYQALSPQSKQILEENIMLHAQTAAQLLNPGLAQEPNLPPPPPLEITRLQNAGRQGPIPVNPVDRPPVQNPIGMPPREGPLPMAPPGPLP